MLGGGVRQDAGTHIEGQRASDVALGNPRAAFPDGVQPAPLDHQLCTQPGELGSVSRVGAELVT